MLIHLYKIANWLYRIHVPILPNLIYYLQYVLYNSSLPPSVQIGKGTKFGYGGIAVVIHERTVIGNNCIIGQCVTIGGRSKHYNVPKIGHNVHISAGARVLGPITLGDNSIIGANAVVIHDVPANSIAAGVPARIIKDNINPSDYY
jgi:serine O-acetyltransferase